LPELKRFLERFPVKPLHAFEETRCVIEGSLVTLFQSGKLVIQGRDAETVKQLVLSSVQSGNELVLGIDESGRGEGFGDFCIAAVMGYTKDLRELRDSKKVSDWNAKKRVVEKKALGAAVISFSAGTIDAFRTSGKNLNQLEAETIDWLVRFFGQTGFVPEKIIVDGNPLPVESKGIVFLPKADDLEPVVGAASILAKASREESNSKEKRKTWKNA
jgi:ribonuclease HII